MKWNLLTKIKEKFKTKNGNSFLFMPYLVIFGTSIMYIAMEMGVAYVRQVQLQTMTDASARAGIYGGMTGKGSHFYLEDGHVYTDLDDATAQGLAEYVLKININGVKGIVSNGASYRKGDFEIKEVNFSNPNQTLNVLADKNIPVWSRKDTRDTSGITARGTSSTPGGSSDGRYIWTSISNFNSPAQVMSTGNFFVAIKGDYHTIVAFSIIGKDKLNLSGFASALATAQKKGNW